MKLSQFLSYFDRVWGDQVKTSEVTIAFVENISDQDPHSTKSERSLEIQAVSYKVHEHKWTITLREAEPEKSISQILEENL